MKICIECKKRLPVSEFGKTSTGKYYKLRCKPCDLKSRRNSFLMSKYGISLSRYNEILEEQGNCCAICGLIPDDSRRRFSVDHDHNTGEVRGIICNNYCPEYSRC